MANILCITSGLTGILNASFELVSRLEAMGHSVTYSSPRDVNENVSVQGFNYLQLDPINFDPAPEPPAFSGPLRKLNRLLHKVTHIKERRRKAVLALNMDSFKEKLAHVNPDLIVIDIELHEHIMTLISMKQNVLLLSQWFSTWNRNGLPPIQSSIIPGISFNGSKLGMRLSWMNLKRKRWYMFTKKKATSVYTDRRSILQQHAKAVGFPGQYIKENYWPGPFSYDQLPVISMTSQALEFPHDVRPNLYYIGPMIYGNRKDPSDNSMFSQKLNEVFEESKSENIKLIYCSVSTFSMGDKSFIKKVIEAVIGQTEWRLIVSLGGNIDTAAFGKIPENVFVFDQVPQLKILERADLSINHGGIHTINECLNFGVPMLIYSGKTSDQNGCAARVHYHRIGLMADKDLDDSEVIRSKIDMVLNDKSFVENIHGIRIKEHQNKSLEKRITTLLKTPHYD